MGYSDKNLDLGNRNGVTPWVSTGGSTAGVHTHHLPLATDLVQSPACPSQGSSGLVGTC